MAKDSKESKDVNALDVTGCSGNGKTELIKILEVLFAPRNNNGIVVRMDMSKILFRWATAQPGGLGDEIKQYEGLAKKGKYVPDDPSMKAFRAWLKQLLPQLPNLELLLLAGVPRTPGQLPLMDSFKNWLVACVHATREQSDASVLKRLNDALTSANEPRLDDAGGKEVLDQRWDEHTNFTLPMMGMVGNRGVHLDRNDPLTVRIDELLTHLVMMQKQGICPVPPRLLQNAFDYMASPSHRIHEMIRKLDGVQAPPTPRKKYHNFIRATTLTSQSVLARAA